MMRIKRGNIRQSCKKGNAILDSSILVVILFGLALVFFIIHLFQTNFNEGIQNSADYHNISKEISQQTTNDNTSWMDNIFPVIFVFLWLLSIAFASQIHSMPVFFVFTVFGLVVVLIVANIMEESYRDIESGYDGYATTFPKIHWINTHLMLIICVVGFSIAGVLYAAE